MAKLVTFSASKDFSVLQALISLLGICVSLSLFNAYRKVSTRIFAQIGDSGKLRLPYSLVGHMDVR